MLYSIGQAVRKASGEHGKVVFASSHDLDDGSVLYSVHVLWHGGQVTMYEGERPRGVECPPIADVQIVSP